MMYALKDNQKILASPSKKALCPLCKGIVISKCGYINIWHWSHYNIDECDNWSEGETIWHLNWKSIVKEDNVEYKIGNHIADIYNNDGIVIELQNSPISPETIIERENYYQNMIWIFNAKKFKDNLHIRIKDNYFTFRWKYPRRTLWYITKPLFLDFDNNTILYIKKIYNKTPCGGWGYIITKEEFCNIYFRGILNG